MSADFVADLSRWKEERLLPIRTAGTLTLDGGSGRPVDLLRIALANELNVAELSALWMPSTRDLHAKIAFARQSGDEAGHWEAVDARLRALGVSTPPPSSAPNPLFDYLRALEGDVERVAASLFTLESIAVAVNENFMAYCARHGDVETVALYRDIIQPDEARHQALGRELLARLADTDETRARVRATVARVLEIAEAGRGKAAEKLGTACFPGC